MESPKGGWLVFQRRRDGSVDFNRRWNEYRSGFGDVSGEHWLGNDNIFLLTNQGRYQLRIDLWDFAENRVHALYSEFKIDGKLVSIYLAQVLSPYYLHHLIFICEFI